MIKQWRVRENLIGFNTIVTKEIMRVIRIWAQSLLPPAVTMCLYFIIFGSLIGSRLGTVNGIPYMQYLAPGLIMMSIITNAYTNVVSSFYLARFNKSIEEMLVSPLPNIFILLAYVAGGVMRGLMVGFIVMLIALFFTHLQVHHVLSIMGTVLLTATLCSLAGFANGLFAKKFDDISIIPIFVLTPLTYLGGVFYSINSLHGVWREISLANPILYMVNAFRYGILGVSDVPLYLAFSIIFLLVCVLFAVCLYMLNKGIGIRS